jgi:ADP-ribosylglycohydrolase
MDIIMTMPGEGPWDLDPGQVTDDSELTLCLMQGIIKGSEPQKSKNKKSLFRKKPKN